MKYDNMIITIYFDNQTKYCQRLKRIDKGLKKIWAFKNNKWKRRRERNLNDSRTKV